MPSVGWMTPWTHSGTSYQRCHLPARLMIEHAGWDALVGDRMMWTDDDRIAVGTEEGGFIPDVVVISWWAPERSGAPEMLDGARAAGQKIVLDVDDNPWAHRGFANPDWRQLIRHVDATFVTTESLANQLAAHWPAGAPIRVVPTLFDPTPYQSRALAWRDAPTGPVLAYRGGLQWHARDVPALRSLTDWPFVHFGHDPRQWHCQHCSRHVDFPHYYSPQDGPRCPYCGRPVSRSRFAVAVVDGQESKRLDELTGVNVIRQFRLHTYSRYARILAAAAPYVTLGVIPLEEGNFSEAKTHIGGLEWSAVGVPWVATGTAEYRRLAGDAADACIVRKKRHWRSQVGRLLSDPVLRENTFRVQLANAERLSAVDNWSTWADALAAVAELGERENQTQQSAS